MGNEGGSYRTRGVSGGRRAGLSVGIRPVGPDTAAYTLTLGALFTAGFSRWATAAPPAPPDGARRALVISELAGAAMLLIGAGLLIRSYVQLQHVEPGFEPGGVTTFSLSLPAARYADPGSPRAFVSALLSRLEAEPGVESAAVAMGLPFTSDLNAITGFRHEGQAEPDSAAMPSASMRIVTPDYFQMMRIPIRNGRPFDRRDTATSPEVVLINERAAQRFFSGQNAVGRQIRISAELARDARNGPKTIVGVVGDIKYGGLDEDTPAEIYLPFEQHPVDAFTVAVRTSADRIASIPTLRYDVAALDPLLPLANLKGLAALVDASLAERRFTILVLLTLPPSRSRSRLSASTVGSHIWSLSGGEKSVFVWQSALRHPTSCGCS